MVDREDRDAGLVEIDGAHGEGGGQVLRSSLSLSLVTGRGFRIRRIRARRRKPGLLRQHLTAVQAAARIGAASVEGAELGSGELVFRPHDVLGGRHEFAIGSAGSTTLVLQTVLPGLLSADAESHIVVEGGTHNPMSPPFDFLERSFVPLLRRMGADIDVELERHGFVPAGGGRVVLRVRPSERWPTALQIGTGGGARRLRARAVVADLPASIAEREAGVVQAKLGLAADQVAVEVVGNGPGNFVCLEIEAGDDVVNTVTAYGAPGVAAERVAARVVREARAFLRCPDAAIDEHLADQLLVPMALAARAGAGASEFTTVRPSSHTTTNVRVVEAFCARDGLAVSMREAGDGAWLVRVA